MRKTSVEINERLLDQARHLLGAGSIKETINGALREVVNKEARHEEIRALSEMDGLDLSDQEVMARAWRS